jgi:hypothetical protein
MNKRNPDGTRVLRVVRALRRVTRRHVVDWPIRDAQLMGLGSRALETGLYHPHATRLETESHDR